MHKKGSAAVIVLGVVLLIVILAWAFTSLRGECRTDSACGDGKYCGADRACHTIPVVEKEVIKNNFLLPSIIIALSIVIGAVLLHLGRRDDKELQQHYDKHYRQWYESQVERMEEERTVDEPVEE